MKTLPLEWFKHLQSPAEKKELEQAIRHDTYVLGRLLAIVDEKLENVSKSEVSYSDYENPSWAYKQAHLNGVKHGLTEVRKLLAFLNS